MMDPLDLDHCDKQQLPDTKSCLIDLLSVVTDCAELAALAAAMPDTLAVWGSDSLALRQEFREVVRDRYRDLTQAQLVTGR